MDDGEQHTHGNRWVDDGEEWLSLAQRAERRRLAQAISGRDARRDWSNDVPAGSHYAEKTGHKARGEAAKLGHTARARFALRGEPDNMGLEDGTGPFNPLAEDPYNNRGFNKPVLTSPDASPMLSNTDAQAESPRAEKIEKNPRVTRDRPTTKPPITRGR